MNHVEHEKLTNRRKFHRNLQDRKNITFWNNSCLERNFLTCLSTILQQISPQKPHKSKITRLEKDANPKVNVFNELVPKTLSLQICEVQKSPSKTVSFLFLLILHDQIRPLRGDNHQHRKFGELPPRFRIVQRAIPVCAIILHVCQFEFNI